MQPLATYQKLYGFLLLAGLAGFVWLGVHISYTDSGVKPKQTVCLIKQTTGIPCPSCGNTRAMVAAIEGDFGKSLMLNPMGVLLLIIMIVTPLWIVRDLLLKDQSFYRFYGRFENFVRKKWIAIPLIGLVLANWIWNISKEI